MKFVYDYSELVTYCPCLKEPLVRDQNSGWTSAWFFFSRLVTPSPSPPHHRIIPFPLFIMAKATKPKAAKSPQAKVTKQSCTEPSRTGGKKTGRTRKKTTTAPEAQQSDTSNHEVEESIDIPVLKIPARVVWDKYPERTERLLDYLDAHPDVAIKLFGDSTQGAKLEGRTKLTAKSNKGSAYLQVAEGIFSIDDDAGVRADFATNPNKYAKAVDNYITNT